jgi:hypothetical protein
MMRAAKRVSRMVVGMTMATTIASRQPMASATRMTMEMVARPRWKRSSLAFSLAVSP